MGNSYAIHDLRDEATRERRDVDIRQVGMGKRPDAAWVEGTLPATHSSLEKKTWLNWSYTIDISELERFGEEGQDSYQITSDLINQARKLVIAVYTNRSDAFEDCDLAKVRAYKFLNNRSTMLKLLPPTEPSYRLHLQRAALATIIDKTAHVAKPQLPPFVDYGWALDDGKLVPVLSTQPAWPQTIIAQAIACGCSKGCNRNCSCARKNVDCYIGCRCQGSDTKCSRVKYACKSWQQWLWRWQLIVYHQLFAWTLLFESLQWLVDISHRLMQF